MIDSDAAGLAVAADLEAITGNVRTFFAAFVSGPQSAVRLDGLRAVFLPGAVIVRTCGGEPAVYGIDSFIAPRQALLSRGTLVISASGNCTGHTQSRPGAAGRPVPPSSPGRSASAHIINVSRLNVTQPHNASPPYLVCPRRTASMYGTG